MKANAGKGRGAEDMPKAPHAFPAGEKI